MNRLLSIVAVGGLTSLALLAGGCSSQPAAQNKFEGLSYSQANTYSQVAWTRPAYAPAAALGMASGDKVAMKLGNEAMYARAKFRQNPALPGMPQTEITTVPVRND